MGFLQRFYSNLANMKTFESRQEKQYRCGGYPKNVKKKKKRRRRMAKASRQRNRRS